MISKKKVRDKLFYFTILGRLEKNTNLKEIQKDFDISKQNLNYYLRKLNKEGFLRNIGRGHWEIVKGIEHTQKKEVKQL
jgi:predicted transcriptional regulator